MTCEVEGMDEILANLDSKLGPAKVNRVINKALRIAGEKNNEIVKEAVSTYMDTGKTYDLVVTSNVKSNPKRVETGWASKERAPLVHLEEFGYTRYGQYIHPRGMGKLQEAENKIKASAFIEMQAELKELVE